MSSWAAWNGFAGRSWETHAFSIVEVRTENITLVRQLLTKLSIK